MINVFVCFIYVLLKMIFQIILDGNIRLLEQLCKKKVEYKNNKEKEMIKRFIEVIELFVKNKFVINMIFFNNYLFFVEFILG